jgi:hypothetical protein
VPLVGDVWFEYSLSGHGWADAGIGIGAAHAALTASYLSDALGDLLHELRRLCALSEPVQVTWMMEPGEYRWLLTPDAEQVHVRIVWFDDWDLPEDRGAEVLTGSCSLDELVRAIASGASRALHAVGEDDYNRRWEHPFPASDLAALHEALRRHNASA